MIKLFNILDKIGTQLFNLRYKEHKIDDYRIVLGVLNNIVVYLKKIKSNKDLNQLQKNYSLATFVKADSEEYNHYFENHKITQIEDSRLRFTNLLDSPSRKPKNNVPVVTFYSYKGGVGRTTALASFASHLAINKEMKVVIMDCDFEAPGLTNFFMEDPDNISYKNGLVEYFLDSELEDRMILSHYYWEASKKFSGKGSIYVFHAGNLSSDEELGFRFKSNLIHYMNGLTRLDIFSKNSLNDKFKSLFNEVQRQLQPDIILLDSRTGFNDVFGVMAFRLSDVVLGFFGSDAQSRPGIDFFLSILTREKAPRLMMAHSIIPSAQKSRLHKKFVEYVEEKTRELSDGDLNQNESDYSIECFPISDNDILRYIGKPTEDCEEFISMISNQDFSDYRNLFEKLYDLSMDSNSPDSRNQEELLERERTLQLDVLKNTKANMPSPYADDLKDFSKELENKHYFFRKCMEDLFNPEKFLVLGAKGTGKSYIYQSLGNDAIVDALRERANKADHNYLFVQVVNQDHFFDTIKLNFVEGVDFDLFYERFWILYIWNVVMSNEPYGYKTPLQLCTIKDDTATAEYFKQKIMDDKFISEVESDLIGLDMYIYGKNPSTHLVIIFDELDNMVKPKWWSQRISPLINLCKKMAYSNIQLKVFLRSDLYEKIENINNKNDLKNRTIDIEWSREELFSYFFKIILSHSKESFIELMRLYAYHAENEIEKVVKTLNDNEDQPPLDDKTLSTLTATFFGKYASVDNNTQYGLSYNWFFNNLKNANETLNLRPFIDLLTKAIEKALSRGELDPKPILSSNFYANSEVRSYAVMRHINDLSSEDGNRDLKNVLDYIREKASVKYKKDALLRKDFDELLSLIIEDGHLEELHTREELTSMLLVNGVIRLKFFKGPNGSTVSGYQFALLYKYYLGLRTKMK